MVKYAYGMVNFLRQLHADINKYIRLKWEMYHKLILKYVKYPGIIYIKL